VSKTALKFYHAIAIMGLKSGGGTIIKLFASQSTVCINKTTLYRKIGEGWAY
jgi:hypothetical protein